MKKLLFLVVILACVATMGATAQESKSSFSVSTDIVSSYVWRGTKFGNGPAFQPGIEFSAGGFSLGAWGSYCMSDNEAAEADLYASYAFDFGLSLGATKYYFPGSPFFAGDSHAFELNGGFESGVFSLSGNYILNEGAGAAGGDLYFELGLTAGPASFFVGAGDGWYTPDGKFNLCNVGVSTSKEIKITDSFSLPVFGSAILNPKTEQFHIVVGISL